MGTSKPKQYLELGGRPILSHTLDKFEAAKKIDAIVLVTDMGSLALAKDIAKPYSKVKWVVTGGEKRQDSVAAGLKNVPMGCEVVCVHDGVRPFISPELIDKCMSEAASHGACIVAVPVRDTIKRIDGEGRIVETVERAGLWRAQTPQAFNYELFESAMNQAMTEGFYGTDDAALVERTGHEIFVLSGDEKNIKITTVEDLSIAESLSLRGA